MSSQKNEKTKKKRNRIFYSWQKSPVKSFIQVNIIKFQNQIQPNEQTFSYPVNYYSRTGYDWRRSRPKSRNRFSPYRCSHFKSPSFSLSHNITRSRYRYHEWDFNFIKFIFTNFLKQRRVCRSSFYNSNRKKRYRSFSRSNSTKRQNFGNYKFLYQPPTKPCSRSTPASRGFFSALKAKTIENAKQCCEKFSVSWNKFGVNNYTTELTIAITSKSCF